MDKEKMNKAIVTLILVTNSLIGLSQIVVSVDDQNTLYRGGYKNRVTIGTMDGRPFDLKVHNGTIIYDTIFVKNNNEEPIQNVETVLLPGGGYKTKVVFVDPDTGLPFDTLELSVSELPKPTIRLGSIVDGESATSAQVRAATRLFAGYPPEIPLKATFSVTEWEVQIGRNRAEGKGAEGKGAALDGNARRIISQAQSGDVISVYTSYREPGGGIKRRNASFRVK